MKIFVVTQYFWPETFIINDLVIRLNNQGHDVTVLTGKPNYPDGVVFDGYSEEGVIREKYEGVIDILRVPLRARKSGCSRDLVLNYLSFIWSGLRYFPKLVKDREADAILVFAPSPITSAIPAVPLKWIKKAHLAIWVQDLWPQSLAATGHVSSPLLLRVMGWVVGGIYYFADSLLIQSRAFHEPVARLASDEKIVYYPNSISTPSEEEQLEVALPTGLNRLLQNKFCMVFAGNIGTAQSVETIVQAALQLKDHDDIRIVMVGSGSRQDWVSEQQEALQLDNLYLAGRFPMQVMPIVYRNAAGLIVTLKNEAVFSLTIPSKIQAYLAAGKPIVAALNGEGARIIRESGAGLACAAEDAKALAQAIITLYEMNESSRQQMGNNGHAYFIEHFEMGRQTNRLIEILEQRMILKERGR